MAKLLLSMNGQTLTVKKTIGQVIEKSHQYLDYEFENFSSDWNGVVKDVIFTHGKNSIKATNANVPDEVIQAPGFLVSVVGYLGEGDEKRLIITTNSVPVQVHPAGATEGSLPTGEDPDADWLEEVKNYAQEFRNWLEFGMGKNIEYKIPFIEYNTAPSNDQTTIIKDIRPRFMINDAGEIVEDNTSSIKFSPIMKCPKYLGFRIEGDAKLNIYIGTMEGDKFVFGEDYLFNVTNEKIVNHLSDAYSTFLETEDNEYFYYRVVKNSGNVTIYGADEFPQSEINGIATTNQFAALSANDSEAGDEEGNAKIRTEGKKYYSIVLPTGCFYAILNKVKPSDEKNSPSQARPDGEYKRPTFNISYQRGGTGEVQIIEGASFGYIPDDAGAALLRFPTTYTLDDFIIYTDKKVKSSANSGRRRKAKDFGKKITEDFYFNSKKDIFWNDSIRPMKTDRRFYGVPYSSRWVNSHYVGFEVSPTTALNALNDPYSVAYDGGFDERLPNKEVSVNMATGKQSVNTIISEHTEITGDPNNPKDGGGPGYGLVCSAFTCLINGNPYPQSNRGYTFDSNFVLENTIDMNSGEVLVNKGLTHCVFVDETYNNGFSLYEAIDPCVAKTIHTALEENAIYARSKVRTSYLDNYIYSVVNKDISGYDNPEDKFTLLKNFDAATLEVPGGKVRPWRGHRSVYGPWDKEGESNNYQGSGIGLTLDELLATFILKTPSHDIVFTKVENSSQYSFPTLEGGTDYVDIKNDHYIDISKVVAENGTYEVFDGSITEEFRFYNHEPVRLTFDAQAKAIFKNPDGTIADDVEYVYIGVKGYGGTFSEVLNLDQESIGDMVIAKGSYYPDLALDTERIIDIRAAIISDISTDENKTIESWGKYSCIVSPEIESNYKGDDTDLAGRIRNAEEDIQKNTTDISNNTSAITENTQAISDNANAIAGNTSAIATNTSAIATNTEAITNNTNAIAINTAAIAESATLIGDNTKAITNNTNSIEEIQGKITDVDKILSIEVKDNVLYIKYLKDTKEG